MAKLQADLATALKDAGGSRRRAEFQAAPAAEAAPPPQAETYRQPGRAGTKLVGAHFPEEVSDQLKIMAVELKSTSQDLIAEALNDFFAKHGKPEIAPRKRQR